MSILIVFLAVVFVISPVTLYIMGRRDDKNINIKNKSSVILFNAVVIERNIMVEKVFETLDKGGIKPAFLQNKTN